MLFEKRSKNDKYNNSNNKIQLKYKSKQFEKMDDLFYRPPQSTYKGIDENEDEGIKQMNALQVQVRKLFLISTIIFLVSIPIGIAFISSTRQHSFTCKDNQFHLFNKYLEPMKVDNSSVVMPMYGTIILDGIFYKKKNEDIQIQMYSVNNDGIKIDKGIQYDISNIEYPENYCESANVYLSSLEKCTKVQFILTTIKYKNMTNESTITNDLNDYNQILDKVNIEIISPESVDKSKCSYNIEFVLLDNSRNNTYFEIVDTTHFVDPFVLDNFKNVKDENTNENKLLCIRMENVYTYSFHNGTNNNDIVNLTSSIQKDPIEYSTIIGCNQTSEIHYYDLSSRCKDCKLFYSNHFSYVRQDQNDPLFTDRSTVLFYNYISEIYGKEKYPFRHSDPLYSRYLYPYIYLDTKSSPSSK